MANTQINLNSKVEIVEDRNPQWIGLQGTVLEIYSEYGDEYANLTMSPDQLLQERQEKDYPYTAVHFKTDDLKVIDSLRAETEEEPLPAFVPDEEDDEPDYDIDSDTDETETEEPNDDILVDGDITLTSEEAIPDTDDVEGPTDGEGTVEVTIIVTSFPNEVNEVIRTVKQSEALDVLATPGDTYTISGWKKTKTMYRVLGATQSVTIPLDSLQSVVAYIED